MDYIIKGDSDCPIAEIHLQTHETVKIERGSMAYMSNVSIEGKMNSNKKGLGGVLGAIGRSVSYEMKSQSVGKALFGGSGGFFVMHTFGQGDVMVSAFGDILEIDVDEDHPITIDNEHVVAWDDSLNYEIKVASGTFGFTTGEGLVNAFHGNGKVYIQTRNIHNLADALIPFMPQATNHN